MNDTGPSIPKLNAVQHSLKTLQIVEEGGTGMAYAIIFQNGCPTSEGVLLISFKTVVHWPKHTFVNLTMYDRHDICVYIHMTEAPGKMQITFIFPVVLWHSCLGPCGLYLVFLFSVLKLFPWTV